MKIRSLRGRLLALAAVMITLALIVAGITISFLFSATVQRSLNNYLLASVSRLVGLIDVESSDVQLTSNPGDARYEIPFGGLYWQISDADTGVTARSPSLWDSTLGLTVSQSEQNAVFQRLTGPKNQQLASATRLIDFHDGNNMRRLIVTTAADLAPLDLSGQQFSYALALALIVLGITLMSATVLQVQIGIAPLDRIRSAIAQVTLSKAKIMSGDFPSEVQPLVKEINALLALQDISVTRARQQAADLAHGLKTPLSVLDNLAAGLESKGDLATSTVLRQLSFEMLQRVQYQLQIAKLRQRTSQDAFHSDIDEALRRTFNVVKRTKKGEALIWNFQVTQGLSGDIDARDLIELLGILLENASKWAASTVDIQVSVEGQNVIVEVEDDGKGMSTAQISALGQRGLRLDEIKSGSGLGIAIATDIVQLNGGSLNFSRSRLGGLKVDCRLPKAQ